MPIVKTELKVLKVLELVHKLKLKLIKGKKIVTLTEINEIYEKLDLIYDNMVANRKYNSLFPGSLIKLIATTLMIVVQELTQG